MRAVTKVSIVTSAVMRTNGVSTHRFLVALIETGWSLAFIDICVMQKKGKYECILTRDRTRVQNYNIPNSRFVAHSCSVECVANEFKHSVIFFVCDADLSKICVAEV